MSSRIPGLYIGNVSAARDPVMLRRLGITHIVDLSQIEYRPAGNVHRLIVPVPDREDFDMRSVFGVTNGYIRRALHGGGRVLVHCRFGVSRSATVVLAYLMAFAGMAYADAAHDLIANRPIVFPNKGFHEQLAAYDAELRAFKRRTPPARSTVPARAATRALASAPRATAFPSDL